MFQMGLTKVKYIIVRCEMAGVRKEKERLTAIKITLSTAVDGCFGIADNSKYRVYMLSLPHNASMH